MLRLVKASDFLREVSQSSRLKFELTWLTFGGLVVPAALLMSLGFAENYVLPVMLVLIVPFQYASFCIFQAVHRKQIDETRPNVLLGHPPGASQEVRAFASALRSFLRSDPDALLLGDVPDAETADILFKAALRGYTVFLSPRAATATAWQRYLDTIARMQGAPLDQLKMVVLQVTTSQTRVPPVQQPLALEQVVPKDPALVQMSRTFPQVSFGR